ncbi:TetR/AcrR family transcriptional regulator [Catenuloplanes japonicus]|uniref:TetR/AcrR family transcriptional regulator n=1 Tax=Catenuloplanes japonicus TaxID=33876 RepID=UPI000527E6AA|nr:TetR/AcrR family transcriptional regulator [Catenuloplanes japonicus]
MQSAQYHSPRREAAAAATRAAILDAARELFLTDGYAATTLPRIARAAGIAVPTVYTSLGAKAEILAALIEPITTAPTVRDSLDAIAHTGDPAEVLAIVGEGIRQTHEQHRDAIFGLFPQARSEPAAAAVHARILHAYQEALGTVADHLETLGALRPGLTRDDAATLLWFHFGDGAWKALCQDCGWPFDRARDWLVGQAKAALLAG